MGKIVEPAEDAPSTRAEMLEQAERLGIRVDRRWSDARLLARIDEVMREQLQSSAPAPTPDPADNDPI